MTRGNTAVLLIDQQVGLFTGVRDLTVSELKHNVVALAKAVKILGLPIALPLQHATACGDRRFQSFAKFSARVKSWIAPVSMRGMMGVSLGLSRPRDAIT
jgi:hypothetical protein